MFKVGGVLDVIEAVEDDTVHVHAPVHLYQSAGEARVVGVVGGIALVGFGGVCRGIQGMTSRVAIEGHFTVLFSVPVKGRGTIGGDSVHNEDVVAGGVFGTVEDTAQGLLSGIGMDAVVEVVAVDTVEVVVGTLTTAEHLNGDSEVLCMSFGSIIDIGEVQCYYKFTQLQILVLAYGFSVVVKDEVEGGGVTSVGVGQVGAACNSFKVSCGMVVGGPAHRVVEVGGRNDLHGELVIYSRCLDVVVTACPC